MQEFSSVTASSYDAESLAPLLTEKSAEGWDVVSIVAAGTNIVAYLTREGSADADAAAPDTAGAETSETVADDAPAEVETAPSHDAEPAAAANAYASSNETAETVSPTLPGDDAPYVPADAAITTESAADVVDAGADASNAAAAAAASAVDEPAGWASAPDNDVADLAAQVSEEATAGAADAAASTGAGAMGAAGSIADATGDATAGAADHAGAAATNVAEQTAATAEPAAAEPAAAETTVPAGWYADPSGRYELRYWDGGAWTEHVSRAGQQFTDPPVA